MGCAQGVAPSNPVVPDMKDNSAKDPAAPPPESTTSAHSHAPVNAAASVSSEKKSFSSDGQPIVMGKYKMSTSKQDLMGEGTSSICRKGVCLETNQEVAIKVYKAPKDPHKGEDVRLQKFRRQISVLNMLQEPFGVVKDERLWHPQLASTKPSKLFMSLLDYSKDASGNPAPDPSDGVMYVVTELAQYSLKDYLSLRRDQDKGLSRGAVKNISKAIILVVAGLHAKGLVHLDLKPENLMMFNGRLKLIDVDGCVPAGSEISIQDSSISFSPCYCAPEWARFLIEESESKITVNPHLDVWSVGMTVCELATLDAVLKPMYANFLRNGHSHKEAGFLFMDWLGSITKAPLPKSIERFDEGFHKMLVGSLLVCDHTNRKTLAQCLSDPYLESDSQRASTVDHSNSEAPPLPVNEKVDRTTRNRIEDTSSKAPLFKGTLWKLNNDGNAQEPAHWLKRDMWVAFNGSLCYFSIKENKRLVLVDGSRLTGAKVTRMSAAREHAFRLECAAHDEHEKVCKVAWPPVVVHAGIQEVEYQLMVIPDSAHLLPFVGAVIIAPGQQDARNRSRKKNAGAKSSKNKEPPKTFPLKSVPKLVAGQARLKSVSTAHLEGLGRDDYVVTEFTELCPDLRYAFQVLARYPTVGPRTFHKIYEVDKISRLSAAEETQDGDVPIQALLKPVPTMVQVPLLEESREKMQRWLQDGDGCLVLLTWQGLVPEAENPRQASILKLSGNNSTSNKQYEVQAASFTPYASESAEGREWIPCPVVSAAFPFEGSTCIAVRSLPFAIGQFRLFDPHTMRAGPATAPIVTVYERVEPPGTLEMVSKGDPPRTLGVQLQIPLDMPKGTGSRASCCQIRFRTMGREESDYKELQPQSLPESGAIFGTGAQPRREAFVVVREEDGLELGHVYEFQVRIGDRCRIGTWSRSFRPLRFALSLPVPLEGSGLKVVEQGDHAEISWTPFQPDVTLAAQLPGFANLPIEYTLSVLGGSCKEPLSSIVTSETRAVVHGLHPLTSYSTMLVARWSRFGKASAEGRDKDHVLMASFVTSGLGGKKVTAELSVRLPTEQLDGYGPVAPAKAKIPVQGGQPAAVTLDLDPYFVQPRLHHCSPDFVRKPTVPSQREVEDEEIAAESAGPPGKLPSLVPMPPPKFTTRDPLSFALLTPGPGSKPSGGPRPSPRRRLP